MDNFKTLIVEQTGEVVTVSLNRPKLNLFNSQMIEELIQVWHSLRNNRSARFVVLTAVGDNFTAGFDLGGIQVSEFTPEDARIQQLAGHEMMRSLESLEQITVAALRGAVVGAGMAIAQACDFRIVTENCYFSVPETMIGLYYTWGCTPRLVRMLGASKAMEIILTCDPVPAKEAYRLNLANKIVPNESLMEKTRDFVSKIASRSPASVRITKKIALGSSMVGLGNMLSIEPELVPGVIHEGDFREGVAAFLEKRPPEFQFRPQYDDTGANSNNVFFAQP